MENEREDVFSKAVRAGKRTYYFDVKTTRSNDLYLTITERKKLYREDGSTAYEKHKVFLYQEDFDKFMDGLKCALDALEKVRGTGGPERQGNGGTGEPWGHPDAGPSVEE